MAFDDQVGDFRVANQGEFRVPLGLFGEEVKKIPLRYEGDIRLFVAQPFQAAEVTEGAQLSVAVERDVIDFLMGEREEFIDEPDVIHDPHRGGMHSVPAEVTQEITVLFQDHNVDPGPGQQ
ncbi:Uncharacterised protein [Mycobacteroides abscessus subsp. abscessus]|nr:Uncharacterised protein [Mycobacteroides abscessus subsp. abscessus]